MKLAEFMNLPLKEAVEKLELTTVKPHTDEHGNILAVELKYASREGIQKEQSTPTPRRFA